MGTAVDEAAMEDEPRTSNFSCQSCRIKKIKCDKTFPCTNCIKNKLECVPQTRKRARPNPGSVTAVDSEIPFKKFIGLMEKTLKDAALFVQRVPDAGVGTRIVDWLRQHTHRLQSREEFFSRKESSLTGEESFPATMWHEWFGME